MGLTPIDGVVSLKSPKSSFVIPIKIIGEFA
jgi:hypothetical protein